MSGILDDILAGAEIIEEQETGLSLRKDINDVIQAMEELVITSEKDFVIAGEWLISNKEMQKKVKDHFEEERAEKYAAYKAVTDTIKTYIDALEKAEKVVKKQLAAYQAEQDRIRREKEEAMRLERMKQEEEARKAGLAEIMPEPVYSPEPELAKVEGLSFVENWTFEITNASALPAEYLLPDDKKIRAVVKAMKGDTNIPGVRAYAEKQVRARA